MTSVPSFSETHQYGEIPRDDVAPSPNAIYGPKTWPALLRASRESDPGYVELTPPDWRTDVTDEEDVPDDGDGGNPAAAGSGE